MREKKKIQIHSLLFILLLYSGCLYEENLPYNIVTVTQIEPATIEPPCNYDDTASVSGRIGMTDAVRIDIDESFDYTDITLRFYRSAAVIRLRHRSRYGLRALRNEIIDYGAGGILTINMSVIDWGISNYPSMYPEDGKMYIKVLDNDDVQITWCDIKLRDRDNKYNEVTYGGITITP
jgi:hypothetical protein